MSAPYELPPDHCLRVTSSSGDITVVAEERDDIDAPEDARVRIHAGPEGREAPKERTKRHHHRRRTLRFLERLVGQAVYGKRHHGPLLEIRSPRGGSRDLEVRCPIGTPVSVGTISGDVRLMGDFGPATVATASGDVIVNRATAVDARSVSGDLAVDCCSGLCRLSTKSGHIEVGESGPAEATTVSGRIRLLKTVGGVTVRTVSGKVDLSTDGSEAVNVRTVSGGVTVKVPRERLPAAKLHSLSGRINCVCSLGSDFPLSVASVSGKIEVEPA